jgi:hypothetical protein
MRHESPNTTRHRNAACVDAKYVWAPHGARRQFGAINKITSFTREGFIQVLDLNINLLVADTEN